MSYFSKEALQILAFPIFKRFDLRFDKNKLHNNKIEINASNMIHNFIDLFLEDK